MDLGLCRKLKAPTVLQEASSDRATEPVVEDARGLGRAPEPVVSDVSESASLKEKAIDPRRRDTAIDQDSKLPPALEEKCAYALASVQKLGARIKCSVEAEVLRNVRDLGRYPRQTKAVAGDSEDLIAENSLNKQINNNKKNMLPASV